MNKITGSTRVFYILGDPVAQVRAPDVYNHLFARHGIDAVLVPLKLPAAALAGFVEHGMKAENIGGFWATIPHKAALAELLKPTDPVACIAGAVNAVKRHADGLRGLGRRGECERGQSVGQAVGARDHLVEGGKARDRRDRR